jgi:Flp pilus assembly protein TadG
MFALSFAAARSLFAALLRDRRGVAAVFLAVSLVPVIGGVGLAIDSALGYLVKTRMGKSLDAAGLAAGRIALDDDAEEVARNYFDANFGPGGRSVEVIDFDFELDPTLHFVTLSAEATTPTFFMRIFGHDMMTVSARTVIERQTTGMELALVMDNTGSLWADPSGVTRTNIAGTPFEALQNAAGDLIDILYGEEDELENVWVSLVPYVASVNIGPSRTGWLAAGDRVLTNPASFRPDLAGGGWKGCVTARAYPWDVDDSTPSAHPFTSFFWARTTTDNNWNTAINDNYTASNAARKGPNLGCGTPITPLTKSRATIETGIAAMRPWRRGGTTGPLGLAWGWRTISPAWRGLWGDPDLPLDYGTDYIDKVVVMLTDGNNTFYNLPDGEGGDPSTPSDSTAYGRLNAPAPEGLNVTTVSAGETKLNARMTEACTAMKAKKIKIYTIIFGSAPSATTRALYESCATSEAMYYYAPTPADLAPAFRAIGGQLANLLIVE